MCVSKLVMMLDLRFLLVSTTSFSVTAQAAIPEDCMDSVSKRKANVMVMASPGAVVNA